MLDERHVLAALDRERRVLARNGEVLDLRPAVTRLRAADNSHHVVIYASLSADTADSVIEEQIEHYCRLGVDFEWKVYAHDAPPMS